MDLSGNYQNCIQLNAQFRLAIHLRQVILEDRLRHIDRGEHVGDQADGQSDGESPDRAGAEDEQEYRRNHGGDVRVDDGQKRLIKAGFDSRRCGLAIANFFPNALEYQNVGVHAHTDG